MRAKYVIARENLLRARRDKIPCHLTIFTRAQGKTGDCSKSNLLSNSLSEEFVGVYMGFKTGLRSKDDAVVRALASH